MKWIKNSKKGMAAFGAVAVMLVAGWQFGVSGTEAPFSEKDVALEKAIAGSGSADCCEVIYFPDLCTIQYIPVYREYYGEYFGSQPTDLQFLNKSVIRKIKECLDWRIS
ncbi:hypothetical protein SAMN04488057_11711 [Cyclobacterium lianum]|uniref:Uncharacterized protein n=2 Tax=Cyclobacterium lianum TaxID=388280 RepID=A0A1M7QE73_9BACT|nr:hypothetical protein SAMN04488057_11711 [Cyclobacterium lianum]